MSDVAAAVSAFAPFSCGATTAYARAMDSNADDSALMLRYRDGDVKAFEILYRRHKDPLYRYLLRQSLTEAAAEDVFQEVWSRIIRSRRRYRPSARFTTFLYHVAHNCFIDHLRRNSRHAGADGTEPDAHPDPGDAPDALAERSLARGRLETALAMLPREQRDTFLLHEEAGLTLEQVADVTGCSRETAKSRLRYAIRKLRDALNVAVRP